jgi:nitroreductase
MNLTELIMRRRSCRKFTEEPVSVEDIKELKRVAVCSPTSKNCRSWEFVFVQKKEVISALSRSKDNGASFMEFAPLAIVVLGNPTKTDVWVEDASIAATYLQLKAEELGLGSCWVQMRERGIPGGSAASDTIKALINAPEELEVECVIAVGHKAAERSPYTDEKLPWEQTHDENF